MMRKDWIVLAAIALGGCSDDAESDASETGTAGSGTAGTTSLADASSSEGPTFGSTSDLSGTDGPGADETTSTGGSASETTAGVVPHCGTGEPTVLFSSAEHIGTIPWPSGGPYLWGMQSWRDRASGSIAESADDFKVPEGQCWCITSVNVIGQFTSSPAEPTFDVGFYDDVDGLPAESPWMLDTHAPTTITPLRLERGPIAPVSHAIDFAAPAHVATGRAWISMVAHVESPHRFDMNLSTDTFGNLSTAYRRDPDCPAWAHVEDCYPHLPAVELAFELHGWATECE